MHAMGAACSLSLHFGPSSHCAALPAVCKRVGGGFGGKVSRPQAVAIPAALAAIKTGRPVRFVLSRNDDFRLNGGKCLVHSRSASVLDIAA